MRFLLLLLLCGECAFAGIGEYVGEKLRFEVKWGMMTAGYADMMCLPWGHGAIIRTVANANATVQSIYPVRDTVESYVRVDGYPVYFAKKVHEGSYWARFQTKFSRMSNTAVVAGRSKGKLARPDSLLRTSAKVHDILSAFYTFRSMPMVPGGISHMDILDNRKMFRNVEVHCLRRERVTVPAGTFDCLVVEPKIHSDALFKSKGSLLIWLTDDERRLPVKMESRISLGRIRCNLVRVMR